MKKAMVLFCMILIPCVTYAWPPQFTIEARGGATEPLDDGELLGIASSSGFAYTSTMYSNAEYVFFDDGIELGRMAVLEATPYLITGDQIDGQSAIQVNGWTTADQVELKLAILYMDPVHGWREYHTYSDNRLDMAPTNLWVPSMSVWGIIVLLLAIPLIIMIKR